MNDSIEEAEQKRREMVFTQLEDGFTDIRQGRSGFVYYKNAGRLLEIYKEMSGVPEYNFLVSEEGLEQWVYPNRQSISPEQRTRISKELAHWLRERDQLLSIIFISSSLAFWGLIIV